MAGQLCVFPCLVSASSSFGVGRIFFFQKFILLDSRREKFFDAVFNDHFTPEILKYFLVCLGYQFCGSRYDQCSLASGLSALLELHVMGRLKPWEVKQIAQPHERLVLEIRLEFRSLKKCFIEVKFTKQKIKHFLVNNSVAFSSFTMLYKHRLYLALKDFQYPKRKLRIH